MGFKYLIWGCVFFFLPNLSFIDILPDFIGCILILKGLSKISDLAPKLYDAKQLFKKSLYIALAQFGVMFLAFSWLKSDAGLILVSSFVFAVLDLIFLLPAFRNMLDGILYLGNRNNSAAIFKKQTEFSTLTGLFICIKAFFSVVPDLSYLSNPEQSGTVTQYDPYYLSNYKTLLTSANLLIVSIVGIIWLVYAVKYFNGIVKDNNFIEHIKTQYENEILSNHGLLIKRKTKFAFVILTFALVFMADFLVDNVNIIPDFAGGLFFIWFAVYLRKQYNTKPLLFYSIFFTILSGGAWAYLAYYSYMFPAVNLWSNFDAYEMFIRLNIVNSIKCASLIPVIFFVAKIISQIVSAHTGSIESELKTLSSWKNAEKKSLLRINKVILYSGCIVSAVSAIRLMMLYSLPEFWLVDALLNIVWITVCAITLQRINNAIDYRYI